MVYCLCFPYVLSVSCINVPALLAVIMWAQLCFSLLLVAINFSKKLSLFINMANEKGNKWLFRWNKNLKPYRDYLQAKLYEKWHNIVVSHVAAGDCKTERKSFK